jgi:hypothetical protein
MKKLRAALFVISLLGVSVAWARIALTTAATQTITLGGNVVDTANVAVVGAVYTDFQAQAVSIIIPMGTWSGTAFTQSAYAAPQSLAIDLVGGTYRVGNGTPLPIPSGLLSAMQAAVKNYRNSLESLANQAGAAPGTITVW